MDQKLGFFGIMARDYIGLGYAKELHTKPLYHHNKAVVIDFETAGPYLFAINKKFYLPNDTELDISTIVEMEAVCSNRAVKTPTKGRILPDHYKDCFFVLADHDGKKVAELPLMDIISRDTTAYNIPYYCYYQNICIGKSYIICRSNTAALDATYGIMLLFKYK